MALPISFTALALDSLTQRLISIVGGLRQAVAARGGRDRAVVPLVLLLWTRLGRLVARFEVLVGRVSAGRPTAPSRRRSTRSTRIAPVGAVRLPQGHAWLVRVLPGEAACFGGQLQALLADPGMAALLAADPQAGRILRPLCRMLAVVPEGGLVLASAAGKPAPRMRAAKPAPAAPPPSAISLIWAALIGPAPAVAPDPSPRKPPWLVPA